MPSKPLLVTDGTPGATDGGGEWAFDPATGVIYRNEGNTGPPGHNVWGEYATIATSSDILIQKTSKILTDAQIISLPTTTVVIVPSPGPSKRNLYVTGHIQLDTTNGAYDNVDADCIFSFRGLVPVSVPIPSAWALVDDSEKVLFDAPAYVDKYDSIAAYPSAIDGASDYQSSYEDQPIILRAFNGTPDLGIFTGGHADNSLTATVYYSVIDL